MAASKRVQGLLLMMVQSSPSLIELLRSTLEQLESSPELQKNDAAMRELKSSILRTLAELEVRKSAA
jgi:hypothetical protein